MNRNIVKCLFCTTLLSLCLGTAQAQMAYMGRFCLEAYDSGSPDEVKRYMELDIVQYETDQWSISGWIDAQRDASDRYLVTGKARLQGGYLEASLVGGAHDVRDAPFQAQVGLLSPSTFVGIYSDSEAADPYGDDIWTTRMVTCE